ncbi:MAG TPA: site-2 protease family protein [Solirubrobacterales bacterium]|jgi:regulator of sigma E protease|nr:site-2 protease family protein [Solirubrobacterales bacterium]
MSWLLVFLGFSALIVLHEAGHFVAAKATGMRVEKFFLFFGPKLVSIKRGETEYGIAAIPAGGYVKISGMHPEDELPPGEEHRGYYEMPVWKRIVVIGAGPAVNIVLAFLILFALSFSATDATQTVGEIVPGSPAAAVLKPGDRIVSIDGSAYPQANLETRLGNFGEQVASHRCAGKEVDGCRAKAPVTLQVERDGAVRTIVARPEYDPSVGRMRLGFSYGTEPAELGVGGALDRSTGFMWLVTHKTFTVFANLLDAEQRKEVSGVVGTSDVAHQTIERLGATEALILLAVVSLSLGLINLFPFLPLDGGHIFWSLVEKVRGRPVPYRVMERAGAVGFVLVIMLFFLGLSNDIGRLTGEGFNVR